MGAFEWDGTPIIDEELLIRDWELGNYPNPFNPTTTISFNLSNEQNEQIELVIYNLKGQKVKTININCHSEFIEGSVYKNTTPRPLSFDSAQDDKLRMTQAGSYQYSVVWNSKDDNGKSVSSGIYFYKLKTKKKEMIKKMLLLK